MPSQRTLVALTVVATVAAVACFAWWIAPVSTSTAPIEPLVARESLRARSVQAVVVRAPEGESSWREPDWDTVHDLDTFLVEQGPPPGASEPVVRRAYDALMERDLIGNDVRRFYPRFRCEVRCSADADGPSASSHAQCLEQCGLDALNAPGGEHLASWVMSLAAANDNAELYRELTAAFPEVWVDRQDRLADSPRASLAVLWGQTMRTTAPGLQSSLYTFGKQQQGIVGRVATAASGRTACVWIGDKAVCP